MITFHIEWARKTFTSPFFFWQAKSLFRRRSTFAIATNINNHNHNIFIFQHFRQQKTAILKTSPIYGLLNWLFRFFCVAFVVQMLESGWQIIMEENDKKRCRARSHLNSVFYFHSFDAERRCRDAKWPDADYTLYVCTLYTWSIHNFYDFIYRYIVVRWRLWNLEMLRTLTKSRNEWFYGWSRANPRDMISPIGNTVKLVASGRASSLFIRDTNWLGNVSIRLSWVDTRHSPVPAAEFLNVFRSTFFIIPSCWPNLRTAQVFKDRTR